MISMQEIFQAGLEALHASNLTLYVGATIGLTQLIVDGAIFEPARELLRKSLPKYLFKLFECYQCCGTWCGFLTAGLLLSHNPLVILTGGFAGAFLAPLGSALMNLIEAKTIVVEE